MACSAQSGGISQAIQRGAPGQASKAPSSVPSAKDTKVVVPNNAKVQGMASPISSFTVRG